MPTHLSPPAQDLLRRMLTVDPLHRITVQEIRRAPPSLPSFGCLSNRYSLRIAVRTEIEIRDSLQNGWLVLY